MKDILSYTERFRLARLLAANRQIFPSATSHKRTSLCCKPKIGPGLAGSNESCLPGVRRLVESRTPKREGRHVVSSLSLLPIIMQTLKQTWTWHHLAVPTISFFGKTVYQSSFARAVSLAAAFGRLLSGLSPLALNYWTQLDNHPPSSTASGMTAANLIFLP